MDTISIVNTTVDQLKIAEQIGQLLVGKKLVACIQIKKITSIYEWDDELQSDEEYLLSAKCSRSSSEQVMEVIEAQHPYELPMITHQELECNAAYHDWVTKQCA